MAISDIPKFCSRSVRLPGSLDDSAVIATLPDATEEIDISLPWCVAAIGYVSQIETGIPWGFDGLSGNQQDGQGMSLGVFQWNFGGSAQLVFRDVKDSDILNHMPSWGAMFLKAIRSTENGIAHANSMQTNTSGTWKFRPKAQEEVRAFLKSDASQHAQRQASAKRLAKAMGRARQWALASRNSTQPTMREITYFLDIGVFSGGNLTGVWAPSAIKLRSWFADDGEMIKFVGNWMKGCPWQSDDKAGGLYGEQDARFSAEEWLKTFGPGTIIADSQALLFAHGFIRALANRGPTGDPDTSKRGIFKAQILCRHGVTALGKGKANGVRWPGGVLNS